MGNVWQFDDAFSAFATEGLDADGDGKLGDAELQPLAKINVELLSEFGYFTFLTIDGAEQKFTMPTEYWLEHDGVRLTLFFTLPLDLPVAVGKDTTLEIFDPEYFVAFEFPGEQPLALNGAPDGCTATYHPPQGPRRPDDGGAQRAAERPARAAAGAFARRPTRWPTSSPSPARSTEVAAVAEPPPAAPRRAARARSASPRRTAAAA